MNVINKDGIKEILDYDKIHNMCEMAVDGIKHVSISDIEINAKIQFYDGIKSSVIQKLLIDSAMGLFNEKNENYTYVASRLKLFELRKAVYGSLTPTPFIELFLSNIKSGYYDEEILKSYSIDELKTISKIIDYDRDLTFTYAAMQQWCDKLLVQDRSINKYFELPQEAMLSVAIYGYQKYPKTTRLHYIKKFYDKVSLHKISLPTPILSGVRTKRKQFASCCTIDVDDTKESLIFSKAAVSFYTILASGIGLNIGRIRGIDAKIGNGNVLHTGIIQYLKSYRDTTKEWTQGGIRGGGMTVNMPFFSWQIEDFIHLRSTKTTEERQVFGADYIVHMNSLFLERAMKNEDITLFSMEEAREIYEAMYDDKADFKEVYERYERKHNIRKKKINANEMFKDIVTQRFQTSRLYYMFVDNVKNQKRQIENVYMTNLCVEILNTTKPIQSFEDPNGRIGTCILACVNIGRVEDDDELEDCCDLLVRFLNELIDYQKYPLISAELSTKRERNLGIGISDYFHYLAKNKVMYNTQEARDLTHTMMEKFEFFLIKASMNLAKEKGSCEDFAKSKWAKGILPIDLYNKNVDYLAKPNYVCDWEWLRGEILINGMYNILLSAIPPTANSSITSNSTQGIDPIRKLFSVKVSKKGTMKYLVPEYSKCAKYYTTAWEIDNIEYLKLIAIMQKFIDQSISTNEYYDPSKYENSDVAMSDMYKVVFFCQEFGIKTMYYCHTNDNSDDGSENLEELSKETQIVLNMVEEDDGCSSGACSI